MSKPNSEPARFDCKLAVSVSRGTEGLQARAGGKWIRTLRSAAKGESVPWCATRVLATLEAVVSFCRMTKIAAPMTGDRGFESTSLQRRVSHKLDFPRHHPRRGG